MELSGLESLKGVRNANVGSVSGARNNVDVSELAGSFSDALSRAIHTVDSQEKQVKTLNEQFVTGQISDVHTLMIASEKAQLGLQLTVQVRNKVIEAYQEIMRTQL